jgi:oligopeptide/dipeptide ABC transporter ATP-binding protein
MASLLQIEDLHTEIRLRRATVHALDGVSLTVEAGECLGIVGESGSGKTMTALSIMQLLPPGGHIVGGQITLDGQEISALSDDGMRRVRGNEIGMIFQDPMTSLNPTMTIGDQIAETVLLHRGADAKTARARAIEVLGLVGMPRPAERVGNYPHQLSGGMRQRVMIAMALACEPKLLIADEPTTALDVTIQAQILNLIRKLKDEFGTAVVLITHDLGVVADLADRIAVMYAGRIIEKGTRRDIFYDPQHPYTWGLLGSIARLDRPKPRRLAAIPGLPPSLLHLPEGCAFGARCGHRFALCDQRPDLLDKVGDGHLDACHLEPGQKRELRETTIHPELIGEAT